MDQPVQGRLNEKGRFIKDVEELVPDKVWFCRLNEGSGDKPGKVWRAHLLVPNPQLQIPGQKFGFRGHVAAVTTWRGKHFTAKVYGWSTPFHSWGDIYVETELEAERVLRALAEIVQ